MKISKAAKELTKRNIIKAAVELMTEKGFKKVTMKSISKAAGIGDATIYTYFSTKEKIVYGYYEMISQDTITEHATIDWEFSLQASIQVLIDIYLEKLMPDREFVQATFPKLFINPMTELGETTIVKELFSTVITDILEEAVATNEIASMPMQGILPGFVYEYIMGVVYFWLKDESDEFNETAQMIDLSLGLGISVLTSGLVNKASDLIGFVIKTQLMKCLKPGNMLLSHFLKNKPLFSGF